MSRIYEALQRVRQRADAPKDPTPEPVAERVEVPPRSLRPLSNQRAPSATAPSDLSSKAQPADTSTPRTKAAFPTFLPPEDARTFQDVLRDLARDEDEATSGGDQ